MKRLGPAVVAVSAAVAACAASGGVVLAARAVVPVAGVRGAVTGAPGLGVLNTGGHARVTSVSCPSAGNCVAVGHYRDRHGEQGFVAGERHGIWGRAIGVPGLAALNTGGRAEVNSVSCPSAGNCVTGGFYQHSFLDQGFVATERHGAWGRAIEVPGLAALNKGAYSGQGAYVTSVSCPSAGSCAAVGYYQALHTGQQGFVADERDGVWGRAIEVPGLGALNKNGIAEVYSVSCGSAGNCVAGGQYDDHANNFQGFVADERDGAWSTAIEVPGLGALNTGGYAVVYSVSCGSAGNCAAGGSYAYHQGGPLTRGFVATERDGAWSTAIEVPGLGALDTGGFAEAGTLSCPSDGSCVAAGNYAGRHGEQAFVTTESNGAWGTATQVPGLAALNTSGYLSLLSVSCGSAGNCVAGGYYLGRYSFQAFVAIERDGVWGTATRLPGLAALSKSAETKVYSVSCAPAGGCAAGGVYTGRYGFYHGFVATERDGRWGTVIQVPGLGP